ncbi:hypothetical protein AV656_07450 [Bhargavaea cecembensis]|uniref:C4-dicarboxylate ABC transporter substrate-binding protein n=1 Tax=Bhargavaea cecembensis TaxID=394098 RepID=A0A161SSZ0_9BACL|nr:TRAP transporter substrate-binding protein [Bhargavaea cecembensis]KZE38730.1 hypothetical protein AV656_07450 [Bhargavaea cecembensis]
MKTKWLSIVGCFMLLTLTACGQGESADGEAEASGETAELRFGHAAPATDPGGLFADKIAADAKEQTDGALTINVFPGSQLGGEVEMVEQVRAGTIDIALVTSGALSNFVSDLAVLDLPFLFDDLDHAQAVLNGEVGEEFKKQAGEQGLKILTFFDYGVANIANNKVDVTSAADMDGLKMRTLENEIFIDTFKALGSDAVPIPYPELYTSIQQGVVNGTDALNVTMTGGKLYEVTKHFSKVNLSYRAGVIVMNQSKYDSLPDDVKEKLDQAVADGTAHYHETIYPEYEASADKLMEDNGVKIIEKEDIDVESFKKAVEPVYEKHESEFGDIVERIRNAQ